MVAMKSILRNRRNPFLMAFAIALSIGFLLGANYSITIIAVNYVQYKMKDVPVDYVLSINSETINTFPDFGKLKNTILSVEYVKDVKIVWKRSVTCFFIKNDSPLNNTERLELIQNGTVKNVTIDMFGITPDFVESTEDIIWIKGNMTNSTDEVAVPEQFAAQENLDIGDKINLIQYKSQFLGTTVYKNLTITGIYRLTGTLKTLFINKERHTIIFLTSVDTLNGIIRTLKSSGFVGHMYYTELEIIRSAYSMSYKTRDIYIYVYFDRDALTNVWDINQSVSKTINISQDIFHKTFNMLGVSERQSVSYRSVSPLAGFYRDIYFWIVGSKIFFGILYILLFILMIEFIKAMSYMYKSHRIKELGLLLVRGATQKQINSLLMNEGLIIGVIGLFGGVFLSYIVNWYFINQVALVLGINIVHFWFIQPSYSDWVVAIFLVGLYIYIMIKVLGQDLTLVTPMQVLQTAEEKKPEIISRKDRIKVYLLVFGLVASGIKLTTLALRIDVDKILSNTYQAVGFSFIVWLFFFIIGLINFSLWIFGNVVFIYCAMKLVSLKVDAVSKYLKKIIKIIMGELSTITVPRISKTVTKYARVGFVIGLVVSMGTATAIARATAIDFNIRVAKVSVGADINLEAHSVYLNSLNNLTEIEGVNDYTYVFSSPSKVFIFKAIYTRVVFINPEEYLKIAKDYIENDYSRNGMFRALEEMAKNKTYILINERVAAETQASVGEETFLWASVNDVPYKFNCQVVDIVDALPGFPELSVKRFSIEEIGGSNFVQNPYIVINQALLEDYNISLRDVSTDPITVLVDVVKGYNQTQVAEEISQKYNLLEITTAEEKFHEANINPAILSDVEYLWLEYQIMLLIATLGIVVSMISIVESRKREFGMLIARGATTRQLIKLLISEFLAILLITIPIGVLTGIPSVYAVLPQIQYMQNNTSIPVNLVISYDFVYMAILSAISIVVGIIGAVYMIEKEKVVEVIQFE